MAEFTDRYGSEEQCRAALFQARWPQGFECPECGRKRCCRPGTVFANTRSRRDAYLGGETRGGKRGRGAEGKTPYALRGVFPPLEEQAAIARILDAVDTTIERTHEAVKRARVLEQSVLEKVFRNLVAEPRRLGEFTVDVRYGTSKASNDRSRGNAVLRIPNVVRNRLALDDVAYVDLPSSEVERLQLGDGDLLLVRTNGNPSYVGRSVVFRRPDARIWVYASYLIRVRMRNRILPDYVNVFLGLERGRRELLRRVTTSAGNHNINSNSIRLIRIPVPVSRNAQEQIVELAKGFRLLIDSLEAKARALSNLKRSLMHDLLTGKVRVGDVSKAFAS